jgi:hypothetical protein
MSTVDTTTGEIVQAHMSASSARESVARARTHLEAAAEEVVRQINGKAWVPLGYESWDDMREAEYCGAAVIVPRADRPELVARLRQEGLSQQSIADTVGVGDSTVSRDLKSQMGNEAAPTITNARGQERPTTYAPRARDLPPESPLDDAVESPPAPSVPDDRNIAHAATEEFPDLAYYYDNGDYATVLRLAAALRGYREPELSQRLDSLRKTIAAEQRRDAEPEPTPPGPDHAAMAHAIFLACNKAMQTIATNGDAATLAEAVALVGPLESRNWHGQFEQLANACQRMADACRPKLRSVQ